MLNIFFFSSAHVLPNLFSAAHFPLLLAYPVLIFFLFSVPLTCMTPLLKFFSPPTSMHMLFFFTHNYLGNEISTYLIRFPWQYAFNALQIVTLTPLTPFATHRLATSPFPVSRDLPSSNDIGL